MPDPGRVRLFSTTLGAAGAPAVLLVHGWAGTAVSGPRTPRPWPETSG
ncbi:hypothetical protein STAFG_4802 [Streptomyces afghaniensis 772]|uniref:Alpha/beta hydrolase n=1 Tax=Streptomyces afghaniensis 772 TaxID=1283301 RepID=S4MRH9_9ACTN|nr:hypothetical protein [Streptomyces afghaniensis]EPJ38160.1 hypothetical protein STAFG_4802 [Streptomyces afghaniensis 772]